MSQDGMPPGHAFGQNGRGPDGETDMNPGDYFGGDVGQNDQQAGNAEKFISAQNGYVASHSGQRNQFPRGQQIPIGNHDSFNPNASQQHDQYHTYPDYMPPDNGGSAEYGFAPQPPFNQQDPYGFAALSPNLDSFLNPHAPAPSDDNNPGFNCSPQYQHPIAASPYVLPNDGITGVLQQPPGHGSVDQMPANSTTGGYPAASQNQQAHATNGPNSLNIDGQYPAPLQDHGIVPQGNLDFNNASWNLQQPMPDVNEEMPLPDIPKSFAADLWGDLPDTEKNLPDDLLAKLLDYDQIAQDVDYNQNADPMGAHQNFGDQTEQSCAAITDGQDPQPAQEPQPVDQDRQTAAQDHQAAAQDPKPADQAPVAHMSFQEDANQSEDDFFDDILRDVPETVFIDIQNLVDDPVLQSLQNTLALYLILGPNADFSQFDGADGFFLHDIMTKVRRDGPVDLPVPPSTTLELQHPEEVKDERSVERPRDAFPLILDKSLKLGLSEVLKKRGVAFTIGTMCSGTDAPIMALQEFMDGLTALGLGGTLRYQHVFSVEIEPFKQAFIDRNARPTGHIYRNVLDVGHPDAQYAMTASGSMEKIPPHVDMLFFGSSCVDFSSLNPKKQEKEDKSEMRKAVKDAMEKCANKGVAIEEDHDFLQLFAGLRNDLYKESESAKTFLSILSWINKKRPKVVLMENVQSAPWREFVNFWFPRIGYHASHVVVDSKNFLVPQTRNRGYLIAVDARRYGMKGKIIVDEWVKMMRKPNWFQKFPKLEGFLLPPSDPNVLQGRFILERGLNGKAENVGDASMCKMEHVAARRSEGLGNSNPYTRLDNRGNSLPREDSWKVYISRKLTFRMKELIDISLLRSEKMGLDYGSKFIIIDLGQNVDRQHKSLGNVPCLIPSADFFLSRLGRCLLGTEFLILQGIPIDRIKVSDETDKQLKDLGGNAMTTTVAGAALLLALISEVNMTTTTGFVHGLGDASKLLPMDLAGAPAPSGQVGPSSSATSCNALDLNVLNQTLPRTPTDPNAQTGSPSDDSEMDEPDWVIAAMNGWESSLKVWKLRYLWQTGRRACLCDAYRKHQRAGTYHQCEFCGEIRCTSCAGNPDHHFCEDPIPIDNLANDREGAYREAVASFPGKIDLNCDLVDNEDFSKDLTEKGFRDHTDALSMAIDTCVDNVSYYLTDLKFREDIDITYESRKSRIAITVYHDKVVWNVFLREAYFAEDSTAQDPRRLLRELSYDIGKPIMSATVFYHNMEDSFIPTPSD
ncbi:hypothetical protein GCG54_00011610 [Colletotrichum gloeosporioides]|uniref:Uncharacterized protein n=1 Tax=Colletotrichum gloeosporioides TaxID=474922 RepID=A0A8H4CSN8_COLGL|nr:uncharacterized protein GCG54_00011610 [Colletotrichum gloeosporioides]KAF3809411.1 hypothetical protein GCG54_00011610 [Colletotrichum gloeosporioides]